MKRKINKLRIAIFSLLLVIVALGIFTYVTYSKRSEIRRDNISEIGMKIIVNKEEYIVKLDNNETVLEILKELPIEAMFVDFENSLYVGSLTKKVTISGKEDNILLKNHIYYHPGWGRIVLVYNEYNFLDEKLIHVGEVSKDFKFDKKMMKIKVTTNEKASS